MFAHQDFRQDLLCAREIRADLTFGEEIITIADDAREDWIPSKNGGAPRVNKEVVLRSKLRIAARQLHMSRLQPQTWGDKQTADINDWNLLSQDERRRRADELIQMIAEIRSPRPGPPPIVYRPEEPEDDDQQQRGIGWQPRTLTGRES